MKLGLKFPERLAGPLYPVREALEDLIIGIERGWSQEHLGTGQHNAITAQSIGNPTLSETTPLAITSGVECRQGPMSLSQANIGNLPDPSVLAPPQITANTNDYSPYGLDQALVLRLNVDAARTITGLRRPQPTQARLYWVVNTTTSLITLSHESANSAASNRWYGPGAADYVLLGYGAVAVVYDPIQLRWRILDSRVALANPTASLGLAAVNGTAVTAMRSDGAPALDQSIAPTWTGAHLFKNAVNSITAYQFQRADGTIILDIDSVNARAGFGTTTPANKVVAQLDDAVTSAVTDLIAINHTTSGTQAAGFGVGLVFGNERSSDGQLITDAGRIAAVTESADGLNGLALYSRGSTGLAERMRIANDGKTGFGTTTPANKVVAQLDDAATNTVTDLIAINHTTSGTQAVGFGVGLVFGNERSSDGALITDAGRIAAVTESTDGLSGLALYSRGSAGLAERMRIANDGGVTVASPTGGSKGSGTINVAGDIFKNGTAYTNPAWVFEQAYTGGIVAHRDKMNRLGIDAYTRLSLDELETHTRRTHELPLFTGARDGYLDGAERILASLEEVHLHLFDLHKRIQRLENTSHVSR